MADANASSRQRRTRIRTREIKPTSEPTSSSWEDSAQARNNTTMNAARVSIAEDEAAAKERRQLEELEAFVESKMYMYPGEHGSLAAAGPGGVGALAWGGPLVRVEDEKGGKMRDHGIPIVVEGGEGTEEGESVDENVGGQSEVKRGERSRLRRVLRKLVP